MRIAVWNAGPRPGHYVTGVGKHFINMVAGLAARPDVQIRLVLDASATASDAQCRLESPLGALPATELRWSRRSLEALWWVLGVPRLDRWIEGADWVYCPRELYVPTRKVPTAVTVHDLYALEPAHSRRRGGFSRLRWSLGARKALRSARVVLAVSEFTKRRLMELLEVPEDRIRVVGNGVEEQYFRSAEQVAAHPVSQPPYVLAVGGLRRKKGAGEQLAFARALGRLDPGFRLKVVGPVDAEYRDAAARLPNLELLERGFPDAQMRELLFGARASLMVSLYEGFGIPLLEAMAARVPVLAVKRSALPETVGDAGLLAEPEDMVGLAERFLALEADPRARLALLDRGSTRAASFRWGCAIGRLHQALRELR